MLGFFRHIPSESRLQCVALAKFWINRISGLTRIFPCPIREYILVEFMKPTPAARAVGYDICRATHLILNHIAYQPAVGHSLRHAGYRATPFFYLIEEDNVRKYLLYAIGEILLVVIRNNCPVRDCLSVEIKMPIANHCAVRYNI